MFTSLSALHNLISFFSEPDDETSSGTRIRDLFSGLESSRRQVMIRVQYGHSRSVVHFICSQVIVDARCQKDSNLLEIKRLPFCVYIFCAHSRCRTQGLGHVIVGEISRMPPYLKVPCPAKCRRVLPGELSDKALTLQTV